MTDIQHTGRVDCCVVCAVDNFWHWIDERRDIRHRIKAQRGRDLNAMWVDLGGEAG